MRDKKNFSTLGKIDEKFVEEAESYSVSEKDKGKSKRERKRVLTRRILGVAAAAFVVCAGVLFFSKFFLGTWTSGENAGNMTNAPEADDVLDKSEDAGNGTSAGGDSVASEDSDSSVSSDASDSSSESGTEEDN